VILSERFRALALVSLLGGCGPDGPPRPTDKAPFPMPNPPSSGLPHPQSYDTKDELVDDEVTGLSWQRTIDTGPGENGGFIWQDAVDHCEDLVVDGHDDFRLPARLELVSIVDPSHLDPAIDSDAFPEAPSDATWTASVVAAAPEQSFSLNFSSGETSTTARDTELAVRCVRTGEQPELPPSSERFRVEGGTVLDRMTGLRWERTPSYQPPVLDPETTRHASARRYCDALIMNGQAGFRVPSMKELQTLVDETRVGIAIDPGVFPGATGSDYWSSTFVSDELRSAWLVRFSDGFSLYAELDAPNLVRCVR
jgi:hypothetical protein